MTATNNESNNISDYIETIIPDIASAIVVINDNNKNKNLLFSIMYSWHINLTELDEDDLEEEVNEIFYKELADRGIEEDSVDNANYELLEEYLIQYYEDNK